VDISILILTHNRPELFKRCIYSVINILPPGAEILVNNDSNDITEIKHEQIKYFYYKNNDLSNVYKMLFNKSSKSNVFFLEDDDILNEHFFEYINLDYDINYINYVPANFCDFKLDFRVETENDLFQLSQIIFKKKLVTKFPEGNYKDNDWYLFQNVLSNASSINVIKKRLFRQTMDGNDNISFGKNKWPSKPNE